MFFIGWPKSETFKSKLKPAWTAKNLSVEKSFDLLIFLRQWVKDLFLIISFKEAMFSTKGSFLYPGK